MRAETCLSLLVIHECTKTQPPWFTRTRVVVAQDVVAKHGVVTCCTLWTFQWPRLCEFPQLQTRNFNKNRGWTDGPDDHWIEDFPHRTKMPLFSWKCNKRFRFWSKAEIKCVLCENPSKYYMGLWIATIKPAKVFTVSQDGKLVLTCGDLDSPLSALWSLGDLLDMKWVLSTTLSRRHLKTCNVLNSVPFHNEFCSVNRHGFEDDQYLEFSKVNQDLIVGTNRHQAKVRARKLNANVKQK